MSSESETPEVLTLKRMASRLGVTSLWLKRQAESGSIPGLRADNRWLFRPDVVLPVVAAMASGVRHDR